MAEKQKSLKE